LTKESKIPSIVQEMPAADIIFWIPLSVFYAATGETIRWCSGVCTGWLLWGLGANTIILLFSCDFEVLFW